MNEVIAKGLEISGIGLLGVFGVLLVFYVIAVLFNKIPEKSQDE